MINNTVGLVSIVIPVYNVEKYLDRCLNSIVNQTYENIEILLIDDESPDSCPFLCEEWKKKDSRIRVIHKKNQGLGFARNTGIENAKGEYICFVDSDDYVDVNTIKECYVNAKKYHADVVIFGGCKVDNNGNIYESKKPCNSLRIYDGENVSNRLVSSMIGVGYYNHEKIVGALSCCDLMISTELINKYNWRLVSEREIISEDCYSLLDLYSHVNKAVVVPEIFYYYCQNSMSLTKKYRNDRYEKILEFYERTVSLCNQCGYPEIVVKGVNSICFAYYIGLLKTIINSDMSKNEKKTEFKKVALSKGVHQIFKNWDYDKQRNSWKLMSILIRLRLTNLLYFMLGKRS